MSGLTNSTLAIFFPGDLYGPRNRLRAARGRQVVGVQSGQLERGGEVASETHARREPQLTARLPQEVERGRVVAAERIAHDPIVRTPPMDLLQEIERRVDLGSLRGPRDRIEPDVYGAMAADVHAEPSHAPELLDVHVELVRERRLVDSDVLLEKPLGQRGTRVVRETALEHTLDEDDLGPVETRGHRVLSPERVAGRRAVVSLARVDQVEQPPRELSGVVAGGEDQMDLVRVEQSPSLDHNGRRIKPSAEAAGHQTGQ